MDEAARQLARIGRMRDLQDAVDAELEVTVARACELGVPVDQVAERACLAPDEVAAISAELAGAELATWTETDWVPRRGGAIFI